MARWTQTIIDMTKMAEIPQKLVASSLCSIALENGEVIQGVLRGLNIGNNAGEGGVWRYYGDVRITTIDHVDFVIDILDIKYVTDIWSQALAEEYEKRGLISIYKG
ncbi:hypothetical protein NB640_11100 [Oxalobacter vibrioformis]|uniref:Uncharacterized protein n=1 Tax=Oxalobacter vibrioformis TaxID=933080 RepID=A0A9E9LYF7_9BURK|nr:hypothetical protein [Oxalobacter vibrioformis]WAW09759.1 hypothetical protein NB640_11100 [Oxalobacter vibrioformis]